MRDIGEWIMAEKLLNVKREGDFSYPILFENDFGQLADALKREGLDGRSVCLVADSNTAPLYAEEVKRILSEICPKVFLFTFQAGEASKNLTRANVLVTPEGRIWYTVWDNPHPDKEIASLDIISSIMPYYLFGLSLQ